MKAINKILIAAVTSAAFTTSAFAAADQTSISGEVISLDSATHLIFFDVWASYQGAGPEQTLAALPKSFSQQFSPVWVQPQINVTPAQLSEFQQFYPDVKPIVLDKGFQLIRQYDVWQSPHHVLLEQGQVVFSGNGQQLIDFANQFSVGESQ
ncbi:hypothetical protein Q4519_09665 [Motilimonas sp. 1_MG-2023]|uniref:hypothetical protein n=1 Tax=Motilimonas sp. 1_MG-2023 TaxID=3062672 RepID=UPI0026E37898|nr:hypothetical protein [Motilimonas sp. 1_MG-2023]MDO6525945.1 hypothetical protein [Motilimonas sp. 1_MG-2023]